MKETEPFSITRNDKTGFFEFIVSYMGGIHGLSLEEVSKEGVARVLAKMVRTYAMLKSKHLLTGKVMGEDIHNYACASQGRHNAICDSLSFRESAEEIVEYIEKNYAGFLKEHEIGELHIPGVKYIEGSFHEGIRDENKKKYKFKNR